MRQRGPLPSQSTNNTNNIPNNSPSNTNAMSDSNDNNNVTSIPSRPTHRATKPSATLSTPSIASSTSTSTSIAASSSASPAHTRDSRFYGYYVDSNIGDKLPSLLQDIYSGKYNPAAKTIEGSLSFLFNEAKMKEMLNGCIYDHMMGKAIYLYTIEYYFQFESFTYFGIYHLINGALTAQRNDVLAQLGDYLYYLIIAIQQCPKVTNSTIWRGIDLPVDVAGNYLHFSNVCWLGISSCSKNQDIAHKFSTASDTNPFSDGVPVDTASTKRVLCRIDARSAYDISGFSEFGHEQEVVLLPGSRLTLFEETHSAGVSVVKFAQENILPTIKVSAQTLAELKQSKLKWIWPALAGLTIGLVALLIQLR